MGVVRRHRRSPHRRIARLIDAAGAGATVGQRRTPSVTCVLALGPILLYVAALSRQRAELRRAREAAEALPALTP